MRRNVIAVFCFYMVAGQAGMCQARFLSTREARNSPRGRVACLPSPTTGTRYVAPERLGKHVYAFGGGERNGIVYTCRAGHIDITHVRKGADWTAYLAFRVRAALLNNRTRIVYRMREPSKYYLQITYPPDWRSLPQARREHMVSEVSIRLGQHLAYVGTTWHEVLTWFGFKSLGVYPEYESAFSWEDNYSNALGSHLAGMALRDPNRSFSEAMTDLLDRELDALGPRSVHTARGAGKAVKGQWFTGQLMFCRMIKRHLDIGLDDGFVTPWPVPGVAGCDGAEPRPCPVPDLSCLDEYGFSIRFQIEPKEWEKGKILRIVYPDPTTRGHRIDPAIHLRPLMEHIRAQAVRRYGPYADIRDRASRPSVAEHPHDTGSGSSASAAGPPGARASR